jgi:hypothetical protein
VTTCRYRRYPEFRRIMATSISNPWKGDCGMITTTNANKQQLEAANKDPKSVCCNCWKKMEFTV